MRENATQQLLEANVRFLKDIEANAAKLIGENYSNP